MKVAGRLGRHIIECAAVTHLECAAMPQDAGGKLDILVTNAGVLEQWRPMAESEPEEWWGSYEINIRGSYLAARAAIRSWLQVNAVVSMQIEASIASHIWQDSPAMQPFPVVIYLSGPSWSGAGGEAYSGVAT